MTFTYLLIATLTLFLNIVMHSKVFAQLTTTYPNINEIHFIQNTAQNFGSFIEFAHTSNNLATLGFTVSVYNYNKQMFLYPVSVTLPTFPDTDGIYYIVFGYADNSFRDNDYGTIVIYNQYARENHERLDYQFVDYTDIEVLESGVTTPSTHSLQRKIKSTLWEGPKENTKGRANSVVTNAPTKTPTKKPTKEPTKAPTATPTKEPTQEPTQAPTVVPTKAPTTTPTKEPTQEPTKEPTKEPTQAPTVVPTKKPTKAPTTTPTKEPTKAPVATPTKEPTKAPTATPTKSPTATPTKSPTKAPTTTPTQEPTKAPVAIQIRTPTKAPIRRICRLFGFSFGCCGLLGRWLGFCPN